MRNLLKETRPENSNEMVGKSSSEGKLVLGLISWYDWECSDDKSEYVNEEEDDAEEKEYEVETNPDKVAEHEGLLDKMDEKTVEERLRDHKNFLGQWEMVKQLENELGLHGKYIICK